MRDLRRFLRPVLFVVFALLLLSGKDRLIAREVPEAVPLQKVCALEAPSAPQGESPEISWTGTRHDTVTVLETAGESPRLPTDANGNVLAAGQTYVRLLWMAFSLSDGFA